MTFPLGTIEEALVNAIYNRSYEEREPVKVRITPEELVVLRFPGADRSIRMEDLRAENAVGRRHWNRRVGEFLKELGVAEGRSTGIPKILRAIRENGSTASVFESDDDRTWFLTRLPVHEQLRPQPPKQVTLQGTGQRTKPMTDPAGRLLTAITGEKGRSQRQAALKLSHQDHFTPAYLRPALNAGLIEITLPETPTSRNQRSGGLLPARL